MGGSRRRMKTRKTAEERRAQLAKEVREVQARKRREDEDIFQRLREGVARAEAEVEQDIQAGKAHRCQGCKKVCYQPEGIWAWKLLPEAKVFFCSPQCAEADGFGHMGIETLP